MAEGKGQGFLGDGANQSLPSIAAMIG